MRRDEGSAAVEFLLLTLLLFIPIVYLILAVFTIQGASFAAAGSAREAARILATTSDATGVNRTVEVVASLAFEDFSLDVDPTVTVACESPGCEAPGSLIHVTVSATVPLPLIPSFAAEHAAVPVTAHSTAVVDHFRER